MLPLTPPRVLTLAPVRRLPPPGDGFVEAAVAVTERGEALVLSVEPAGADAVWADTPAPVQRDGHAWRIALIGPRTTRWHYVDGVHLDQPLIDRLPDGRLLLAGRRMALGEHRRYGGTAGANAVLFDPRLGTRVALRLGHAIGGLAADALGRLWVSYLDEGVSGAALAEAGARGDYAAALSAHGLVCLDHAGQALWRYPQAGGPVIDACYAMNVTGSAVWAFAYADFALTRVGAGFAMRHWETAMQGSSVIAVAGEHVLFGPQYGEPAERYHLARLTGDRAEPVADVTLDLEDGPPMTATTVIARGGSLHAFAGGGWYRGGVASLTAGARPQGV
ncbi:MAG: hypothetical protein AAFV86_23050 [Pseudomonadota bacterium]